jgi:hypothetical protein
MAAWKRMCSTQPVVRTHIYRSLAKATVIAALMLVLSTQWALLQSVAWLGMLVSYSYQVGFSRAVTMTFDGKHPCRVCKVVNEGQARERQSPKGSPQSDPDVKLHLPPSSAVFVPPFRPEASADLLFFPGVRNEEPPTPPPRSA